MQHSENNFNFKSEIKNSKEKKDTTRTSNEKNNQINSGPNANPGPVDDSTESIISPVRYQRKRKRTVAAFACQSCNKRKVKCDVASKNYPTERCTHCEEYDIECVPVKRRKKRTKEQIEADRLREGNTDGFNKFQFRFVSPTSFSNQQSASIDNNSSVNKTSTTSNSYSTSGGPPGSTSFLIVNPIKDKSGKKSSDLNSSSDASKPNPSRKQNQNTSTYRKTLNASASLKSDIGQTASKKILSLSSSASIQHPKLKADLPISIDIDSHTARLIC
ncbi:unnamed protein product [Ambrosiozyma monospora]|uniref:Unnamed protein product n=1 Tax=Ambrosiozyma monospora TaxID=43982 RepID=A0ACB5TTM1_AMBMO|nr:unnamed protein product [Ambrosiozyma monospora]